VGYDYLESHNPGKLINTLGGETWRTGEAVAKLIGLVTTLCTTIVYVGLLVLISLPLTMVITVAMTCISFLVRRLMRSAERLGQETVKANALMGLRMYEGVIGMRTIRAFGREAYENKRFDNDSQQVRQAFLRLEILSGGVQPLYEMLSSVMVLFILIVAVQYVREFLPALLTFLFMLYRLQPQIQTLESYRTSLIGLCGSIDDVLGLLDPRNKPYVLSGQLPIESIDTAIRLKRVSFIYPGQNDPAIEDVSLCIPLGKTTAFVGPSGAGKSTLIHLICRLYDPTGGEISVNDQPLNRFRLKDWKNNIAIVSQDVHIFNATIADNIAYGRLDATTEEVTTAAKQAHADDFISKMPLGYDSMVGDRGLRLSGGQRQRLALARAIIRNPNLLILDEATNALDSISEHLIQQALALFSKDRTVIVIAHRLSTIEQADQIVVLNRGRVMEHGTLDSLLSQHGLFREMHSLQQPSLQH
jgi:subfamily B ATP-binding cassette protein MsbA